MTCQPSAGEPQRVAAVAASEVQNVAGRQIRDRLDEASIGLWVAGLRSGRVDAVPECDRIVALIEAPSVGVRPVLPRAPGLARNLRFWQDGPVDRETERRARRGGARASCAPRRDRGITLADLATTTGVSESTLSRLESGQRRATLELLLPLARTYDVPLDDLVGAPRTGDPRIHLTPIRRFGMTFVPLSRRPGGVQAFKMIIPARPEPPNRPRRPTRASNGCTCSTATYGWCSASAT